MPPGRGHASNTLTPSPRLLLVGDERLQLADGDRYRHLADDAVALAQGLLGAEAAAHVGGGVGGAEHLGGAHYVALLQLQQGAGDIVVEGAGLLAGSGRTLDAAGRLDARGGEVVAQVDLPPVLDPLFRVLFRN